MGKKTAKTRMAPPAAGLGIGLNAQSTITCNDGTQIPAGKPPGVSQEEYEKALEFLKANPQVAKAQVEKMSAMMQQNPKALQEQMMMMRMMNDPQQREKLEKLREDEELKPIFEDVKANGPSAFDKYMKDPEWQKKIIDKMGPPPTELVQQSAKPQAAAPAPPTGPPVIKTLHDAAKHGDLKVMDRCMRLKQDINGKDARGVCPLGVAVGYNKMKAAKKLLDLGAAVDEQDSRGNTPLHYAAGYGRKEMAELLLEHGANPEAKNKDEQTPVDVAQLNKVEELVALLTQHKENKNVYL